MSTRIDDGDVAVELLFAMRLKRILKANRANQ
jgi:hypothetical protein